MDGTLIDSTAGVERAWENLRDTYPNLDVHSILSCEQTPPPRSESFRRCSDEHKALSASHGVRTIDSLRKYAGITDIQELEVRLVYLDLVSIA
jgi:beta-phosphoglucomutase-like phosphatase (HAD superfamily)